MASATNEAGHYFYYRARKQYEGLHVGMVRNGILFTTGIGVGAVMTGFVVHPPLTSGDWASWAQALGVTVGIGIAIWVPREQRRYEIARADETQAREEFRLVSNALEITKDAFFALQGAQKYIDSYDPEYQFDHTTERLETAQLLLIDAAKTAVTHEVLHHIIRINRQITLTIRDIRLRHADEEIPVTETTKNNMVKRIDRANEGVKFIRRRAKLAKEKVTEIAVNSVPD